MNFQQAEYLVKEAFRALGRHKALTTLSIIIMSLTLLVLAVFLLITDNMLIFMSEAKEEIRVYVYLEDGLTQEEIGEHYRSLLALDGVETLVFVSKAEALAQFRRDMGQDRDLVQLLETNPLPASFRVTLKPEYREKQKVEAFAASAAALVGVEEVAYGKDFLEKFTHVTKVFLSIDVALGLIVLLSSIFIIANTVRLTIMSRRRAIEVLKLVGATNRFITTPFVIEGAFQSGVASLLSLLLLYFVYSVTRQDVPDAAFLTLRKSLTYVAVCVGLGALGSYTALRRFLKL